jgi:hypothetical protein
MGGDAFGLQCHHQKMIDNVLHRRDEEALGVPRHNSNRIGMTLLFLIISFSQVHIVHKVLQL